LAEAVKEFWEDIHGMNDSSGENVSWERKDLSGIDEQITNEQVKRVIVKVKNNKAAGMEERYHIRFISMEVRVLARLTDLFIVVWTKECTTWSMKWKSGILATQERPHEQ
jgi:hypothetical protein